MIHIEIQLQKQSHSYVWHGQSKAIKGARLRPTSQAKHRLHSNHRRGKTPASKQAQESIQAPQNSTDHAKLVGESLEFPILYIEEIPVFPAAIAFLIIKVWCNDDSICSGHLTLLHRVLHQTWAFDCLLCKYKLPRKA